MIFAISGLCVGCSLSFYFIHFYSPALCAHNPPSQSLHNIYYATLCVGGPGGTDEYDASPAFGVKGIKDDQEGKKSLTLVLPVTALDYFEKRKWLTGQIWSW